MFDQKDTLLLEIKNFILENVVLEADENAEDIAREVLRDIPVTSWFRYEDQGWEKDISRLRELALKEINSWL